MLKKVKYILEWYKKESKGWPLKKKFNLLNQWISDLLKFEEYEAAEALRKEKEKLLEKGKEKTLIQKIKYFFIFPKK